MSRYPFITALQIFLPIIAFLSLLISTFWLILEPGFDSLLAFLGSTAALITLLNEQYKNAKYANSTHTSDSNEQSIQEDETVSLPKKHRRTNKKVKLDSLDQDTAIVDKLYSEVFMPLKYFLFTITLLSVLFATTFLAMVVFEADEMVLVFAGFFGIFFLISICFYRIKRLHTQISTSGFYDPVKSVARRELIKKSLQEKAWGNLFLDLVMQALISFLLITNKTEANKFMRQMKM